MNEDTTVRGQKISHNMAAKGAIHKIRIRGLFGLAWLEIESGNSKLIFAIVLLVLSWFLLLVYMLKTL